MITRITKKTLLAVAAEEQLGEMVDKMKADRTPGTVGISRTEKGNYMVYWTGETGKLTHTSVHANRREAFGRCLERMRQRAAAYMEAGQTMSASWEKEEFL